MTIRKKIQYLLLYYDEPNILDYEMLHSVASITVITHIHVHVQEPA